MLIISDLMVRYENKTALSAMAALNFFKDPVLSIMHCAVQKSAAIFFMLKNPVGLIALYNPFASAMSVVKRLFMYLIILGNT